MQSAGVLVPPTSDDHGNLQEEPNRLWQITYDKIEQFMPGFMESVIPPPTVTVVPSTASTTPATSAEKPDLPVPNAEEENHP